MIGCNGVATLGEDERSSVAPRKALYRANENDMIAAVVRVGVATFDRR
jgi:hypothetical protein